MNLQPQEQKYADLIKKLRRRRLLVTTLTVIAILAIFIFAAPASVTSDVNGVTQTIEKEGLPFGVRLLLVFLCFLLECVIIAVIMAPLRSALDQECDPEKQLILNAHLNKNKLNANSIYASDYFYLGDYEKALLYTYKMIESGKRTYVISGLFQKARCAFALENKVMLYEAVTQYEQKVSQQKRISEKQRLFYQKSITVLQMLCALADNDREKISELRTGLAPWANSKATEAYIEYLKARASLALEDTEDASFRFRLIKDRYPKLALARLCDEELRKLSGEEPSPADESTASEEAESISFSDPINPFTPKQSYQPLVGRQRTISILLVIVSILSIWGALLSLAIISALTYNFTVEIMWVFLPFAIIPMISILFGFSLKKKGYKYKKNVITGFIMASLLCLYGCFPIFFKDTYSHSEEPILAVEQRIGIELPTHAHIDTQDWTTGTQTVSRGYIFSVSNVYFDDEDVTTFEAELVGDERWLSSIPSAMIGITSDYSDIASYDYCLIYNIDTQEINKIPTEEGGYRMINLFYDSESNEMTIVEYEIEYVK
ncbi:MAG: hypothetical protein J6Q82_03525 [Clostridia bacterium]|nr:hypothetical protein [Clostridia bacterium]